MARSDAIVLGAGIVGVSIALHLIKRGSSVALIERAGVGEQTSYGNAGVIEGSTILPPAFPASFGDLLRVALKRGSEANYHLGFLAEAAPWLLAFRAASRPKRIAETARLNRPLFAAAVAEHKRLMQEAGASRYLRETGWLDTAHAYDLLPEDVKARIADLKVIHSYATAHAKQTMVGGSPNIFPDVIHPLVATHPYSGRKSLNISPNSAKEIIGLPKEESDELIAYLAAHTCREEQAYKHEWKHDDVVLWDNWRTMHRAYGHRKRFPRLMHRTTLSEPLRSGRWVEEPVAAE